MILIIFTVISIMVIAVRYKFSQNPIIVKELSYHVYKDAAKALHI